MKKDPLIIGTVSVIVIAFTFSLLNIYVFPNIFFQVKIDYNTDNVSQLELIHIVENAGVNSTYFEGLNKQLLLQDDPEKAIVNLTIMIQLSQSKISASFDSPDILPRSITLKYAATIVGVGPNSTEYGQWVENVFDNGNGGRYFSYLNSTSKYEVFSNFNNMNVPSYNISFVKDKLVEIFNGTDQRPDYVIYQTVSYKESRGMFSEYSTEFQRIIFIDALGNIKLFLTNEGNWNVPLLFN